MTKLWGVKDLADYLGVPVNTIYKWRTQKYGPPGRRVGKHLRFRQTDIEAWLAALPSEAA
ncbi:helix-turn-helix transcriptional regulator [Saccharothrix texasensis]|uniref:AlpA family transcriptional regulator n=1 Tax=Saccharothrix texasensis TaxID=103734 RepID=A0A3N1HCI8_9PSEU|nr:helix-turn-helix domain-containing protein [Saccharothrix texasensis]ROP40217.1 AlpA family transcriptional regulator [Saccharothrix texasensis]